MSSLPLLEICLESVESAVAAERGGAQRVELCANLLEGGTTPSAGTIRAARERLTIGISVMVRPRGGDFLYSDAEFDAMRHDITMAKELGADGIVLGLLKPDGTVDVKRTRVLAALAAPLPVTFHRAIDVTRDLPEALEAVIAAGAARVLTSGGKSSVADAIPVVRSMTEQAGDRIRVMPGCGITLANILDIARGTGAQELHIALDEPVESGMNYRKPGIPMGGVADREFVTFTTAEASVRDVMKRLETLRSSVAV
ncbi:copper homeostasis protein CutC [Paracidobacterium acidisoli]|uniref:PF03932 family protein CutC n=1 Tax=Paracidobacterium acidisoli TaxID=2303751 RepID=A0A372IU39_9BACT|nr:copper homeostasis protein CutC [Paracidobacterium acidisoli]MBT9329902.1 copper homeostasis protein CutC [Paracidobacterium acidisoli]